MTRPPIAIIGGSGIKTIMSGNEKIVGTPYGPTPSLTIGEMNGRPAIFLPRHGIGHANPPHRVNFRASIWGLKSLGVERIIATNAVGGIDEQFSPGDLIIPSDILDFSKSRPGTFYDEAPVTHVDMSQPYCPRIRQALSLSAAEYGKAAKDNVAMASMEGPRYETPAEIRMLRILGAGIVSMTAAPEAFLARELEMCYASICFVANMAAGLQRTLSATEVEHRGQAASNALSRIITVAAGKIPDSRSDCPCGTALQNARLTTDIVRKEELVKQSH
jgi:5'-methylthioadenosine phosphorylase